MIQKITRHYLLASLVLLPVLVTPVLAQTRDHLTDKEVELVQEAQLLDKRIEVFIRAIERRLLVLDGTAASNSKQLQSESELWGDLPKGTRADLLGDIAKILDESITNIDDASMHDTKSSLVPKAMRRLFAEVTRLRDQLAPQRAQAKSEEELANLEHIMEDAQSIIEAAAKVPPPTAEPKGKKKPDKAKENN
jgi:hypothetical protein